MEYVEEDINPFIALTPKILLLLFLPYSGLLLHKKSYASWDSSLTLFLPYITSSFLYDVHGAGFFVCLLLFLFCFCFLFNILNCHKHVVGRPTRHLTGCSCMLRKERVREVRFCL